MVEHIPIAKGDSKESNTNKPSHVKSWDENCGWTKLRLFELDCYDTILYIDADCLAVKDVGHLLYIDESTKSSAGSDDDTGDATAGKLSEKRVGLLAAAPDIFPPDKFNAGVMVIRPSKTIFEEMMSRLPGSSSKGNVLSAETCPSYDGGDTGFLNSFYPGWYKDMPSYSRLPFGYNAQRFMHHCTYDKQPKYWDEGVGDIRIIHFSSSPKPWEDTKNGISSSTEPTKGQQSYLNEDDATIIQKAASKSDGKLESMWKDVYEKSQKYYRKYNREQKAPRKAPPPEPAAASAKRKTPSAKPQNTHQMVQSRYKELRKTGMSTKDAMQAARAEYGLDVADRGMDPSRAVGQMFGLM